MTTAKKSTPSVMRVPRISLNTFLLKGNFRSGNSGSALCGRNSDCLGDQLFLVINGNMGSLLKGKPESCVVSMLAVTRGGKGLGYRDL